TDVCKTLKEDEEVAHIPVIMMSALHNVDEICKSAGAVDFLSKPFDMDTLTAKVENILQKQEKSS
ncbi:MAG: response regulator, partial [Gramella sp.]|nr:response regulator [Christiangramia sp.]